MTNVEKLQAWLDKEKENGLTDIKVTPNRELIQGVTAEIFAGDILKTIEGIKKGDCVPLNLDGELAEKLAGEILEMNAAIERGDYVEVETFENFKGESCGPNCDCYPS